MQDTPKPPLSWDPVLRLLHWSLASGVLLNYFWLEDDWHEWIGYVVAVVVVLRVIWGFIGPDNARFKHFYPTPSRLKQHIHELKTHQYVHRGHNPLGALMIFFLLWMALLTAVSGWMQGLDRFWGEDWVQLLHEWSADILIVAAFTHIAAIFFFSWQWRQPLWWAMLSGKPLPPARIKSANTDRMN